MTNSPTRSATALPTFFAILRPSKLVTLSPLSLLSVLSQPSRSASESCSFYLYSHKEITFCLSVGGQNYDATTDETLKHRPCFIVMAGVQTTASCRVPVLVPSVAPPSGLLIVSRRNVGQTATWPFHWCHPQPPTIHEVLQQDRYQFIS
jgi:hypothetical protein